MRSRREKPQWTCSIRAELQSRFGGQWRPLGDQRGASCSREVWQLEQAPLLGWAAFGVFAAVGVAAVAVAVGVAVAVVGVAGAAGTEAPVAAENGAAMKVPASVAELSAAGAEAAAVAGAAVETAYADLALVVLVVGEDAQKDVAAEPGIARLEH